MTVRSASKPWLIHPAGEWVTQGLCVGMGPRVFFDSPPNVARELCSACPVREDCLEYALVNDEQHGVWGGLTWYQRRGLKRGVA